MKSQQRLPSHVRPNFKLSPKTHAAFFGYFLAFTSLVVALYPGMTNSSTVKIAIIVLGALVALIGLVWPYMVGNLHALYGRMRDYPRLHERAVTDTDNLRVLRQKALKLMRGGFIDEEEQTTVPDPRIELQSIKKGVVELVVGALLESSFHVNRESLDKGKLVIELIDDDASLAVGDKVVVVDTADLFEMGTFEVVQRKEEQCYAIGVQDVDGLWLAELRKAGERSMVIKKLAIPLRHGGE